MTPSPSPAARHLTEPFISAPRRRFTHCYLSRRENERLIILLLLSYLALLIYACEKCFKGSLANTWKFPAALQVLDSKRRRHETLAGNRHSDPEQGSVQLAR